MGVVAVSDKRRAVQPRSGAHADTGGEKVASEADQASEREHAEMARRGRVDKPAHGLDGSHERADEDGRDDREPCAPLGYLRAERERDAQRERSQRVAEVVDQVGQ